MDIEDNSEDKQTEASSSTSKVRARRSLSLSSRGKEATTESTQGTQADNEYSGVRSSVLYRHKETGLPMQKIGWVEFPGNILYEWNANPWHARPGKILILALSYVALYAFTWWYAADDPILLIIVPVILAGSAAPHFFPSRYVITEEGVFYSNFLNLNMIFKSWLDIETYVFEDDMGELFFESRSIRNRILRGITVYYDREGGGSNREEVMQVITENHKNKWDQLRDEVTQRSEESSVSTENDQAE